MTERVSAAVAAWREAAHDAVQAFARAGGTGKWPRRMEVAGDALCDANERLERERDEVASWARRCADELREAKADVARLREALRRYGRHDADCRGYLKGEHCYCGLSAALGEG